MGTRNTARLVVEVVAILGAAVTLVLYLLTTTTGYLAGAVTSPWPWLLSALTICLLVADILIGSRLPGVVRDLLVIGSLGALLVSFAQIIVARIPLAADVYFNPVNYPAAEEVALNLSIYALVGCLVGIISLVVAAFLPRELASSVRLVESGAAA